MGGAVQMNPIRVRHLGNGGRVEECDPVFGCDLRESGCEFLRLGDRRVELMPERVRGFCHFSGRDEQNFWRLPVSSGGALLHHVHQRRGSEGDVVWRESEIVFEVVGAEHDYHQIQRHVRLE